MFLVFLVYFLLAFFLSCILSFAVGVAMRFLNVIDRPGADITKIHLRRIPLGGGMAIFLSFFIIAFALHRNGFAEQILTRELLIGMLLGGTIIMIGGVLDDRYRLSPARQLVFLFAAALAMVIAGLDFHAVTNPFGGIIRLDRWTVAVGSLGAWAILSDVAVFLWLSGMMVTTKLLDGLDGLVTGVVAIGAFLLFVVTERSPSPLSDVGVLSLVFAGACLGFLVWNFHPAKIFLGQGGSLLTGFILASLAIMASGKIATTLLVMGIPILDVIRVIFSRLRRRRSIFLGDREHVHHRLLSSGLSHTQTVLLLYAISFLFGVTTLFAQASQRLVAGLFLFVLIMLLALRFVRNKEAVTL